ncbi:uncharacterized protein PHALS_15424 [Plasmopara halstedii]|uniref:Uncharacterized protein n=1 Tax=Plasmopara halstedii TaxID=4781 RepID=A0A0P1AUQ3_PLAHL|nr:uncharacterized protein PHALS_15424 [Plasmopara halstedii]CEG44712.1 hypothetical protein PHALS_15424 [Plasmopara halstedii]|eukprot:XP_024581081.1 hypothetical protein PHALS_15424 [Plasmopara halstedii]
MEICKPLYTTRKKRSSLSPPKKAFHVRVIKPTVANRSSPIAFDYRWSALAVYIWLCCLKLQDERIMSSAPG